MTNPTSNSPNCNTAAVVVMDNQRGLLEGVITADSVDAVGKQVIEGLFSQHYDEVIIVTGHHTATENNPAVLALRQATSDCEHVDMFVAMHTNMILQGDDGSAQRSIAQIPFNVWKEALTAVQSSKLRFLYSMGCYDGNIIAALEAFELGFKTYLGHEGSTDLNALAIVPLVQWMGGKQSLQSLATQTNDTMGRCLPQVGEVLEGHREEIRSTLESFLECNRRAGGNKEDIPLFKDRTVQPANTPRDEEAAAKCVSTMMTTLAPIVMETGSVAATCFPEAGSVFGQIKGLAAIVQEVFGSLNESKLKEAANLHDYQIWGLINRIILPEQSFTDELRENAESARLVVYGPDIYFGDYPKSERPLSRDEEVKKLVALAMQDTVGEKSEEARLKNEILATAAIGRLYELKADRELASIAIDIRVNSFTRELAANDLAKLGDLSALRMIIAGIGDNKEYSSMKVCNLLYDLGDIAYLQEALYSEQTPPAVRISIITLLVEKGRFEEIEADLKGLLYSEKTSPDVRITIATLLIEKGRFEEIEGGLKELLYSEETPVTLRVIIAEIFIKNGQFEVTKAPLQTMLHSKTTPPPLVSKIFDILIENGWKPF